MNDQRSVWHVLRHDGWRWLLAGVLIIAPIYVWVFFYRLSTGDFNQASSVIMSRDPILATFVVPFALAVRVLGWKGWKWPVMALAIGFFASILPYNIAKQLLPGSYLTSLVVLLGVTLVVRLLQPVVLSDTLPYSRSAVVVQTVLLFVCVGFLLPIMLSA